MSIFTNPILPHDPQGLNRLNANFQYLNDKTSALQQPPYVVSSQATMLALSDAVIGNISIRTDITGESNQFMLTALPASTLANWMQLPMAVSPVNSVNGQTGNVVLDSGDILDSGTGQNISQSISQSAGKANVSLLQANRMYPGEDLAVKFAAEIAAPAFNGNVWAWIQARIRSGNYFGINVGDFITFTAAGNTIRAEIAGINTYTRYGSPEVPNHIDFISRDLWPETIQWNLANFNNGTTVSPSPWLASNVYAWLNSLSMQVPTSAAATPEMQTVNYTTTGVLDKLPAALRAVMVQKIALLPRRFTAGSLLVDDNLWDLREVGLLWLPSEMEVYGTGMWGSNLSPNQGRDTGGFVHYPIFATNMKRVKGAGDGGPRSGWWLGSVRGGISIGACSVNSIGFANAWDASAAAWVPLCFRIA